MSILSPYFREIPDLCACRQHAASRLPFASFFMWHLKMKSNAQSSINEPRSTLSLTLPLVVGSLIGIGVLQFFLLRSNDPRAFDELALGPQTTTYWSKIESDPIHCGMEIDHFKSCVDAYVRNGRNRDVVLWLGNSQLHAINQFSKGDKSASFHLHTILRDRNRYLFTISIPNANLQEHLVLFEHAAQHLPVKTLVLPLVFDDTRETGLRENLQSLVLLPAIKERLAETSIGKKINRSMCSEHRCRRTAAGKRSDDSRSI